MRRATRIVGLVALVVGFLGAFAALMTLAVDPGASLHLATAQAQDLGTGLLFAGLVGGPVRALTYERLAAMGNPQLGNEPQAIRHVYFDTATITSTVTRTLTYFTTARGNPNLCNLGTPGQMTSGQYFEIFSLGFDLLFGVSERADHTGTAQDIQQIMLQTAPTFLFEYNSKNYGPYPLRFLHTSGGAVGAVATGTADTIQLANNGATDGGWNWGGGLILCPSVGFSVTVVFNAIPTITEGPVLASFWMEGILSRNVA